MIKLSTAALLAFACSCALADPCSQCHSDWKALGQSHPAASGDIGACLACHGAMKKPIAAKIHSAHSDLECESCHEFKSGKLFVKSQSKEIGALSEYDWDLYKELQEGASSQANASALHMKAGISCSDCHDTSTPSELSSVKNSKCESCHGPIDKIADKTVPKTAEQNPHRSHQGDLNCSKCHSGHGTAKSYCLECHSNFQHKMPEDNQASSN